MGADGRTRVLLLIKGLGLGGAERLLERAIPYLDRGQFDYHVGYFLPWKDALVEPFRAAGFPVHCLHFATPVDVGVLWRLGALVRRERFDVIHAHLPLPGVLARLVGRRAGARALVYTEHSLPSRHRLATRILNMTTYRMNDAIIAVSEAVAGQIRPRTGAGRPLLVTIPNAIDVAAFERSSSAREAVCREFGFPPEARIVVSVGNLRLVKGHRYLLAGARRVLDHEPNTRFLVVGTGPLAAELSAEARRLGLNGQVVFTGFRPDATALIAAADVFVLASLHEGIPISLLEAMALGRPAVLTMVGGIPEVAVAGETAVFVQPRDPVGLATQVLALLRDPERRRLMGEQARRRAHERYGMAQMVAAVEDVYRRVLAA